MISLIEFVKTKNNLNENILLNNTLCVSFIAILVGSILSFLFAVILDTKRFSKIMVKCFHRTPKNNIWEDVVNFEHGSNIKVYLKNEDFYFYGGFGYIEESKDNPCIAISETRMVDFESAEIIDKLNDGDYTVIKLSDVEYIEVINKKTKTIGNSNATS